MIARQHGHARMFDDGTNTLAIKILAVVKLIRMGGDLSSAAKLLGCWMPKLDCKRPDNLPGAVNQPFRTLYPVAIKERHTPYGDLDQDECLVQTASSQPCLLSLESVAGDELLLRLLDASLAIDRVPPLKVGQELANV